MPTQGGKGLATSEFWIVVSAFGVIVASGLPGVEIDPDHIGSVVTLATIYAGGRSAVKAFGKGAGS